MIDRSLRPYTQPEHQPYHFGQGERGALLIHGFPGTPAETRPLGRALAAAGWQSCGVLLPGFGADIENLREHSAQDWLNHVREAWAELAEQTSQRILLGYSMGAALALNLARELEADALILIAPFWKMPGFLPKLVPLAKYIMPEFKPFANADFDDPDLRDRFERMMPGIDMDSAEVRERIKTGMTLPMAAVDDVLRLGAHAARQASQVRCPTLIIQGRDDDVVLPELTEQLIDKFPSDVVQSHTIAGEHEIIHEHAAQKDRVVQLVLDYIGERVKA